MLNHINVKRLFHVACSANWVQGSADLVCQGCVGPSAVVLVECKAKKCSARLEGTKEKWGELALRVCASVVVAIEAPACGAGGDGCFPVWCKHLCSLSRQVIIPGSLVL